MEKFRWAYIGSGSIAHSTAKDIVKGNHKIVSVYGRSFDRVKSFADKFGADAYDNFDKAVNRDDVDAVYIATPHTSHLEYATRAMRLGKPVLCEKPVGVSVAEAQEMIAVAKEQNVYF